MLPQSASSHFSKLIRGGLLSVRTVGRLRLYRLASDEVAYAIETLASIAPVGTTVSLSQHNMMSRLRPQRAVESGPPRGHLRVDQAG